MNINELVVAYNPPGQVYNLAVYDLERPAPADKIGLQKNDTISNLASWMRSLLISYKNERNVNDKMVQSVFKLVLKLSKCCQFAL